MRYDAALDIFNSARNKDAGKPIGNNTRLQRNSDGDFEIVLHSTAIITVHPDNTLTLDTGGWNTMTTKKRLNSYLHAIDDNPNLHIGVSTFKGTLYLITRLWDTQLETYKDVTRVEFQDGMRIDRYGRVLSNE